MTTNTSAFDTLTAAASSAGLPLIGQLVWFNVPTISVTEAELNAIGARHGFNPDKLPGLKNPHDAFRVATTTQQHRGETRTNRFLMRPVAADEKEIIRHIIMETVDARGRKLTHEKVATLRLDKDTNSMSTWHEPGLGISAENVCQKMCNEAREEFRRLRNSIDSTDLHRWVMRELAAMCYVSVHPNGALYFVPMGARRRLDQLSAFIKDVCSRGSKEPATWVQCPVVAVEDMVAQVKDAAKLAVSKEIAEISADVADLLARDKRPAESVVQDRVARLIAARNMADEYEKLVSVNLDAVKVQGEIIDGQLNELLNRVNSTSGDAVTEKMESLAAAKNIRVHKHKRRVEIKGGGGTLRLDVNTSGWCVSVNATRLLGDMRTRPDVKKAGTWLVLRTKERDVAELAIETAITKMR